MITMTKELTKWMKLRRKMMGKSYEEIAEETGISVSSIISYFYNKVDISEKTLELLLTYLGHDNINVTIRNLINNQEEIRRKQCESLLKDIDKLYDFLKDNNITQTELANKLNISRQFVSTVLNKSHKISNKWLKNALKVAKKIVNERNK